MRCLCFAFILIMLAPAAAQQPKAFNTLTAKQVADGWILLFDGETTFGWSGDAKVDKGTLMIGGDKKGELRTTTGLGDCEIALEHLSNGPGNTQISMLRRVAKANEINEFHGHAFAWKGDAPFGWYRTVIRFEGGLVKSQIEFPDGKTATGEAKFDPRISGPSYLRIGTDAGTTLAVRNVRLRPLNTRSLFNGKDLTGWKEFPGRKSKFTLTEKGEINVKDGPGDLQTEAKFANFMLQLDCISHGKHLNSGIFFRCRPGEYQNGYEAQIRNQFTEEPTQKYVIEEYDPRTHKLIGKKTIKANAVDYGTGAIYRRQPARREIAKDGEWFTMTIAAHGNHLASWVNGIQVTDWTDNRPRTDNARTGCRLEAGHISIQGHDPTTNLSFRNIRIAEIK